MLALATVAATAPAALAKDCGGGVPCECGDRMVASTTLTADITNCRTRGLEIRAGILDCGGRLVAGPGDRFRGEGIWINRASGVAVRNCVVRNFSRAILVDSTTDSVLDHVEVFDNNVGIWIGEGSLRNQILSAKAHDNRDEGIHLGAGSSETTVLDSELIANRKENLYLIQTHSNRVINNLFDRSTEASLLLKHASNNFFSKNVLAKRNIMVRGSSSGNVFQNNQLHNGRYTFQALRDDEVWGYPTGNSVRGGRVLKAGTCFMFIGASDNTATEVLADRCRPMQEKDAGGVVPSGNLVELNFIGGGTGGGSSGGGGGGGGGSGGEPTDSSLPKGAIKFDDPGLGHDTLKLTGSLLSPTPLDALREDMLVRLSDSGGTVWEVVVPAGTLRESGRSAKYEHTVQGTLPGVTVIEVRRESANRWSFRLVVKDDLSAANEELMTLTWQIGASVFTYPDTWTRTSEGWRLR